jgi:hypothetical protein
MGEIEEHDDAVHHAVAERNQRVDGTGLQTVKGLADYGRKKRHLLSFFRLSIADIYQSKAL